MMPVHLCAGTTFAQYALHGDGYISPADSRVGDTV